jgi:hypothetical protein
MQNEPETGNVEAVPDELFKLRPYREDAYGESHMEREFIRDLAKNADEANEMQATKARVDIARLIAWSGVIILIMITMISLWVFVFGTDKRLEDATRFLILIMGAVLGATFKSTTTNDQ